MNRYKVVLIIFLSAILPASVYAQANYHDGYVIKNNGDTLKGYIDYREWAYSPLSIDFKNNASDKQFVTFSPSAIRAFEINGLEKYVSYIGLVSTNKNIFPDLPTRFDTTRENKEIFLKQITAGKYLTLYYNNEIYKDRFFVAEKNQEPVELKYYEYYDGTGNSVVAHDMYRGQLILYINKYNSGNKKLIEKIDRVKYETPYLEDIIGKINEDRLEQGKNGYRWGYVVKNNGDTLKGFINYRQTGYSPLSVEFIAETNDAGAITFTPQVIKSFQVSGYESYASFNGLVSADKNVYPNIPTSYDTLREQKAIFLKRLTKGKYLTLYYNNEVDKDRFFIAEKNQMPVELKFSQYYSGPGNQVVTHEGYKGQLLLYINKYKNGNKSLIDLSQDAKFESESLGNIVYKINDERSVDNAKAFSDNVKSKKYRLFGGFEISEYLNSYSYNAGSTNNRTVGPDFNFGIDLFVNPNVRQFVFRSELSLSFLSGQLNQSGDLSFTRTSILITPQFLFNVYNTDAFKIFIDGGLSLNLTSYSGNDALNIGSEPSLFAIFPIRAGVVFAKNFEVSFGYSSFTTAGYFSQFTVYNKGSGSFGFKFLFN